MREDETEATYSALGETSETLGSDGGDEGRDGEDELHVGGCVGASIRYWVVVWMLEWY